MGPAVHNNLGLHQRNLVFALLIVLDRKIIVYNPWLLAYLSLRKKVYSE